ncbi:hypothetical protein BBJ28_00017683 [Nothophytophthora sp. Chile5]|nr:hypothetical protein BBJ28_00017683 [Nothophytophthora sp. Chile5]
MSIYPTVPLLTSCNVKDVEEEVRVAWTPSDERAATSSAVSQSVGPGEPSRLTHEKRKQTTTSGAGEGGSKRSKAPYSEANTSDKPTRNSDHEPWRALAEAYAKASIEKLAHCERKLQRKERQWEADQAERETQRQHEADQRKFEHERLCQARMQELTLELVRQGKTAAEVQEFMALVDGLP